MIESIDYLKFIILLFTSSFLIHYSNISIKGLFGIIFGLLIIYFLIYRSYQNDNKYNDKLNEIKKKIPLLKSNNEVEILKFFNKNFYLMKFDKINFIKSIKSINLFIDIYHDILNNFSILNNYKYNILEKYKYLTIKYFNNIQYNIYLNYESVKLFKNEILALQNILDIYLSNVKKKIGNRNFNIYYKDIDDYKVNPYNKNIYH